MLPPDTMRYAHKSRARNSSKIPYALIKIFMLETCCSHLIHKCNLVLYGVNMYPFLVKVLTASSEYAG
jgi:hypothetical protein